MATTRLCCSRSVTICSMRSLFKPPSNVPYAGVYRKDGEIVRKDELLVVQRRLNYHPGANVRYDKDFGGQHHLISDCDGTVMITREEAIVDQDSELMKSHYGYRNFQGLQKLTFHVIPRRMSNRFRLVGEV